MNLYEALDVGLELASGRQSLSALDSCSPRRYTHAARDVAGHKQTIKGFVHGGSKSGLVQSLGFQDALDIEVDLSPVAAPKTPEVGIHVPPLAAATGSSSESQSQFLPLLPPPFEPHAGAVHTTTSQHGDGAADTGRGQADEIKEKAAQEHAILLNCMW